MISNQCDYKGNIKWDYLKPDGTYRKKLNISKMLDLGWKPKTNLEEGIRKTIASYLIEKNLETT